MLMGIQLKVTNKSINLSEQVAFLERLSKLLANHFTLKRSLEFMEYDPQFSNLAKHFVSLLQDGKSIEDCFRSLKFHPIVIAFLYFSRETGQMNEQIINCHNMLKMRLDFYKKLKSLTKYPLILLFVSFGGFFFISSFLLPAYTETMTSFGDHSSSYWFNLFVTIIQTTITLILCLTIIITLFIYFIYKNGDIERKITIIERIPFIKSIVKLTTTIHFAYHLASTINNGKTVKEGLIIMSHQNDLIILRHYAQIIIDRLKNGDQLVTSTNGLSLIEEDFKFLILRSSEQGTLLEDLRAYSSIALSTLEERTQQVLLMVQPVLYLLIGSMVIVIYLFTLFPMFQLINHM
ncbi:type II secretion system F family protein [Alkalibacillus haloalkaliphilus]|uniref:type II secretion system F family protein n=1 Tax=Alkalibacillus haloalkaliphilus TaxID=94136 RepID=UPI002935C132|nr:type II secretion system F family protein [Alkalibacillus haloalkaliphilus]MDV2580975.1 type II secretion system F family protein [Alkalibacillus haloalkaliphilus]